jgi:hypothetical protein
MNERIQELAEQAGFYVAGGKIYIPSTSEEITTCQKKFAELIVNECVRVMYDNAIERKVPPDIDKTPLQYAIAIKEHFGVEE